MHLINVRHEFYCHRRIDVAHITWRCLGNPAETMSMRGWSKSPPRVAGTSPSRSLFRVRLWSSCVESCFLCSYCASIFGHTLLLRWLPNREVGVCDTGLMTRVLVTPGCQKAKLWYPVPTGAFNPRAVYLPTGTELSSSLFLLPSPPCWRLSYGAVLVVFLAGGSRTRLLREVQLAWTGRQRGAEKACLAWTCNGTLAMLPYASACTCRWMCSALRVRLAPGMLCLLSHFDSPSHPTWSRTTVPDSPVRHVPCMLTRDAMPCRAVSKEIYAALAKQLLVLHTRHGSHGPPWLYTTLPRLWTSWYHPPSKGKYEYNCSSTVVQTLVACNSNPWP
ncbi:hypothetical protein V8C35DRAFT_143296 [Trichoderma chlorosporum]